MATAGRVLMIPAGNWKSGTAYGMLDVVIHSGSSYVAKKNIINSTVAPPNDEANWQLLAQGYDVTNIVTKSMVTGQNVNDANKIPNSALMYAVKQALDTTNSNLASQMYHIKMLQSYIVNVGTVASNTSIYNHIEFGSPMPTTNYTVLSSVSGEPAYWANISTTSINLTKTGFDLVVRNTGAGTSGSIYVTWLAIAYDL